jgi:hypothetical protein
LGSERTSVEGTGLGLPLSRRLAEAMGARHLRLPELSAGDLDRVADATIGQAPASRYTDS